MVHQTNCILVRNPAELVWNQQDSIVSMLKRSGGQVGATVRKVSAREGRRQMRIYQSARGNSDNIVRENEMINDNLNGHLVNKRYSETTHCWSICWVIPNANTEQRCVCVLWIIRDALVFSCDFIPTRYILLQRADNLCVTVSMAEGLRGGSAGIDGRARGHLVRSAGSL